VSQIQAAEPDVQPLSSVPDAELSSVVGRTPWQLFWMRFKRDHVAVGAGVVVIILIALAVSAPFFAHSVIHRGPLDINQDLTSDIGIPLVGLLATRKVSGALLVGLAANFLNQLDTKPGRALKAYLAGALVVGAPLGSAVLLLPYDLRENVMLGDAGSNALGAMLGLSSVSRITGRSRWLAIGALAGLTLLGERRSLGELIERTPGLRTIDSLGRVP